jgi:hypothetical protein
VAKSKLALYRESLEKWGDEYPNELALRIAKLLDNGTWFREPMLEPHGKSFIPTVGLDNFPGQHLLHRRSMYKSAEEIIRYVTSRAWSDEDLHTMVTGLIVKNFTSDPSRDDTYAAELVIDMVNEDERQRLSA